jgi:hypothetical protein
VQTVGTAESGDAGRLLQLIGRALGETRAAAAAPDARVTPLTTREQARAARGFLGTAEALMEVAATRRGMTDPSSDGMMLQLARFITPFATEVAIHGTPDATLLSIVAAMARVHTALSPWHRQADAVLARRAQRLAGSGPAMRVGLPTSAVAAGVRSVRVPCVVDAGGPHSVLSVKSLMRAGWSIVPDQDGQGSPALVIRGQTPLYLRTDVGIPDDDGEYPTRTGPHQYEDMTFVDLVWVPEGAAPAGHVAILDDTGGTHDGLSYSPFVVDYEADISVIRLSDRVMFDDPDVPAEHGMRVSITISAEAALATPMATPAQAWANSAAEDSRGAAAEQPARCTVLYTAPADPDLSAGEEQSPLGAAHLDIGQRGGGQPSLPARSMETQAWAGIRGLQGAGFVQDVPPEAPRGGTLVLYCLVVDTLSRSTLAVRALSAAGWEVEYTSGTGSGPAITVHGGPRYYMGHARLEDGRINEEVPALLFVVRTPESGREPAQNWLHGGETEEHGHTGGHVFELDPEATHPTISMTDAELLEGARLDVGNVAQLCHPCATLHVGAAVSTSLASL